MDEYKDYKFNPKMAEPDDPVYTDDQSGVTAVMINPEKEQRHATTKHRPKPKPKKPQPLFEEFESIGEFKKPLPKAQDD